MKKTTYLFVFVLFSLIGCKKAATEDFGCIERVYASQYHHTISSPDCLDVIALFEKNGLNHNNLRFYRISRDTSLGNFYLHTKAEQFVNGLRLFQMDMLVQFKNSTLDMVSNPRISTSLSTNPKLGLSRIRKIFMETAGESYKDQCLGAELGYYNVNLGTAIKDVKLELAWQIYLKGYDSPIALINDDGHLIAFSATIE